MHEYCNLYFAISTLVDILIVVALFVLFMKIYKNKIIITENNREIYEHDKILRDVEKKIEKLMK